MRNVLLAGSAGLLIALGAASVANANNSNVPTWSPLSVNTDKWQPRHPTHRLAHHASMAKLTEGRAAATTQDLIFSDGSSDENYMVSDHSAAAQVPAGQPSGAPEGMPDR